MIEYIKLLLSTLGINIIALIALFKWGGEKYIDSILKKRLAKFNLQFPKLYNLKVEAIQELYLHFTNFMHSNELLFLDNYEVYNNPPVYRDFFGERIKKWEKDLIKLVYFYEPNKLLFSDEIQKKIDSHLLCCKKVKGVLNESYKLFIIEHPDNLFPDYFDKLQNDVLESIGELKELGKLK